MYVLIAKMVEVNNCMFIIYIDTLKTVMSPTKEIGFIIESSVYENECSLGTYKTDGELETTFNKLSKL